MYSWLLRPAPCIPINTSAAANSFIWQEWQLINFSSLSLNNRTVYSVKVDSRAAIKRAVNSSFHWRTESPAFRVCFAPVDRFMRSMTGLVSPMLLLPSLGAMWVEVIAVDILLPEDSQEMIVRIRQSPNSWCYGDNRGRLCRSLRHWGVQLFKHRMKIHNRGYQVYNIQHRS